MSATPVGAERIAWTTIGGSTTRRAERWDGQRWVRVDETELNAWYLPAMSLLSPNHAVPTSIELPTYGSIEACPKCTCYEAAECYRSGGPFDPVFGEYIESTCRACGFIWRERCADHPPNGDQP